MVVAEKMLRPRAAGAVDGNGGDSGVGAGAGFGAGCVLTGARLTSLRDLHGSFLLIGEKIVWLPEKAAEGVEVPPEKRRFKDVLADDLGW